MKKNIFKYVASATLIVAFAGSTSANGAGIGQAMHIRVGAFHITDAKFTPPSGIQGHDILARLSGKAQYLALTRTLTSVKDGDVLMVHSDILRENKGNLDDYGVNCQLSADVKNGGRVNLGGICKVFLYDAINKEEIKYKYTIKSTELKDGEWKLIVHDIASDIVIYAEKNSAVN